MTIKNVSGETRYFGFGQGVRGFSLANNGTANVPDHNEFVAAKVAAYVAAGVLQVTSAVSPSTVNTPAQAWIELNGAIADLDTVTIADQVYEFTDDPGAAVLGEYHASLSDPANFWAGDGAAAATAAATLRTAINANTATSGIIADAPITYDTGLIVLPLRRADGSPTAVAGAFAVSGTNLLASGATMTAGVTVTAGLKTAILSRAATAADVTAAQILFATGLTTISSTVVTVKTSLGVPKAWAGTVIVTAGNVVITNVGGVDFASTDIVTITAVGV